ncbi:oxysterol-binding protein-related protein 11-like isoform X2 [Argiope bruennichi]|uniref:oxysterol-binding protein-related protein 11-like isoform X2 n=1 Tax=Argiope bruennichi TaxID=94029 RepID=UPI002493D7EF|nr:oxysterol-binding protein-related protein 11-like isoform X2 [Argiope bruennichi]
MVMAEAGSSQLSGASRSIYYSLTDEVPGLTEDEKNKLETVMKKALEFEAEEANKMRLPLEGQLYKYTNVMKGWQYRWFIITPDTGMLEYYMLDERKKSRPRGALYLAGAVVIPSEDDNQSFSVSGETGEVYRLKASDAKERQIWVDKIRSVIEKHRKDSSEESRGDHPGGSQSSFAFCKSASSNIAEDLKQAESMSSEKLNELGSENKSKANLNEKPNEVQKDPIDEIKESVYKALECQKALAKSIEELPCTGPHIKCSDTNLLLIKAISQASIQGLEQCYLILRRCRQREALKSSPLPTGPSIGSLDKFVGSDVYQLQMLS